MADQLGVVPRHRKVVVAPIMAASRDNDLAIRLDGHAGGRIVAAANGSDELAIAVRRMPNNARIFEWRGYIDRRQGRWSEAARDFTRAMELDPQNRDLLFGAAFTYICLREYEQARQVSERGLALASKNNYIRLLPGWIDFHEQADTRSWQAALEKILSDDPASSLNLTRGRFFVAHVFTLDCESFKLQLGGGRENWYEVQITDRPRSLPGRTCLTVSTKRFVGKFRGGDSTFGGTRGANPNGRFLIFPQRLVRDVDGPPKSKIYVRQSAKGHIRVTVK